ncbi:hypothetical protein [Flavobacterium sp.]|uniref:hypothetical protein n=1 Tax=Flavobacterium sp. TaxID=239 RepID=UPI0040472B13
MNVNVLEREDKQGDKSLWYSEEYFYSELERQTKIAYMNGISRGIEIEFHAVFPSNEESVNNLVELFKEKVNEIYYKNIGFDFKIRTQ